MMVLQPWIRKVKTKLSSSKSSHSGYFNGEHAFRFEAARERMRADRNGSPLAILAIELPADRARHRDFAFLSRVLEGRLRITDTVGILSERRVGVLLPDTPKAGAWKVASDICEVYPVGHERPSCDVYVYPDESSPPTDTDRQLSEQPADRSSTQIDFLFAHPTPMIKRALDMLGASVGLIVAAPFLLILAALIKATSPGPVFFAQAREGHGGRRFRMYKLRTMRPDAHHHQMALRPYSEQDGPAFKMRHDPRITWIGRWLRCTSLDELPQLWNVLRGEMSLVGPRPLPIEESLQCTRWQRQRLAVAPGLTCLWQVDGRSTVSFDQWMRMDLAYVRRRSFAYDLELLLRTVPSLVLQRGPR